MQKQKTQKQRTIAENKKQENSFCKLQVEKKSEASLPTQYGIFKIIVFTDGIENKEYVALTLGDVKGKENVLLRAHSKCLTGDTLFSLKCDCGPQLKNAFELIQKEGSGVIIYLDQEGRGIGLTNKIKAYALQDQGYDTVEANTKLGLGVDMREYHIPAKIIKFLGIKSIKLLTNNPDKVQSLEKCGIIISSRIPSKIKPNKYNEKYLSTKKSKLGHMICEN